MPTAAKKATSESKDVQTFDEKMLALYEGGETGFEETTGDDYALPFLKILQKGSPEVDPDSGSYMENAKPGQFVNTATGALYDSIDYIPCHYRRAMVEWIPQTQGGGFVAQHDVGVEQNLPRNDSGKWITDDGHEIADTRYFFGLQVVDGNVEPVVVSFVSTQIKKARAWLTRMQSLKMTVEGGKRVTMPMFANVWQLTTVGEQNEKGSWRGYKIDLVGPIKEPDLAQQAKDARSMFRDVAHRVKPPEEGGAAKGEGGDDIPF